MARTKKDLKQEFVELDEILDDVGEVEVEINKLGGAKGQYFNKNKLSKILNFNLSTRHVIMQMQSFLNQF